MEREILTIKEVAEYLHVNERTMYRLANKGEVPAFKVANAWRFKKEEIERWIAEQTAALQAERNNNKRHA